MSTCRIKKAVIYDNHGRYHTLENTFLCEESPQCIKKTVTQSEFCFLQKVNTLNEHPEGFCVDRKGSKLRAFLTVCN